MDCLVRRKPSLTLEQRLGFRKGSATTDEDLFGKAGAIISEELSPGARPSFYNLNQ